MQICRSHAPWAPWDYASPLIVLKAVSQRMLGFGGISYTMESKWGHNELLGTKKIHYITTHVNNIVTKIFESRKLAFGAGGHT